MGKEAIKITSVDTKELIKFGAFGRMARILSILDWGAAYGRSDEK